MSSRSRTTGLLLPVVCTAVALAACFDRVAAPPPQLAPVPRHDFMGDANWGQNNSAQSGSWDGDVIDSVRGGFPNPPQPLGPIIYPTFIRVSVSGLVRQVPRAFPGQNIVRNAYAAPGDPNFWGAVGFMSNGSMWFALAPETVGRVVAPISPFRNRAGTQPIGDWSHCGMPGYMLCWSWEGSAHLEFERLPADLTLQQSPDTAIWAGQTVTFTAGADPATVAGNPWPIGVMELQWRWIPDDSVSADTLGCGSASGMKCTRVIRGSGTMYAAAYVNGMQQQKSIHLTIKVPELHLTASKYVVAAPGENDTFTATANGSLTVLGWSFTPDGGGADRLEVSAASIIGRFGRARFTTNIAGGQSATSGLLAVPATSRKLASSGSVWDACLSGSTQCTNLVTEAGTVDILAIVNGDTLRASVHVNVVPCPTDDPVLDDPGIRRALKDLILRSKPDLDNGDGIAPGDSIGNKRELAGDIFQRPDGTYYFVEDTLLWSTECKGKRSNLDLRKDPADVKVGDVHTHPDNQLMQAYGCGMVNGVLTQRGPWDTTSGRSPTTKPRDSDNGGGSIEDWMRLALLPENSPPADPTAPPKPKRVDGYILNADGEVWKIPKEMLDFHAPMSSNTQHWRWRLNGNPACNW